jgi:predicted nucleic acid-binding protein
MSERRLVDTNLIIRHLVQDHPAHAKVAARLMEACDRGELILVVLPSVVAESVFVLESFYQHPRADIARVMSDLLSSPGIEMGDLPIHLDALKRYGETRVHFVDCTIAATAAAQDVRVASLDRDFRKFPDVTVDLGEEDSDEKR